MATIVAPIGNFRCAADVILTDELRIEAIKPHMSALIAKAADERLIRHPVNYSHCIVYSNYDRNREDSREIMERLMIMLRLFKIGNVFYNYALIDEHDWYSSLKRGEAVPIEQFAIFFFFGWDAKGLPTIYELEEDEADELSRFIVTKRRKPIVYTRPYRFFFKSYHEPYAEHRFLDYVIAMENILANDSKDMSNIRYKFIDRGCYLLNRALPSDAGAEHHAKSLKEIYDARCEIVHSARSTRDWNSDKSVELLARADTYTRTLLCMLLEDESLARSTTIDSQKRISYQ